MRFIAFDLHGPQTRGRAVAIETANPSREWMVATESGFANRCLPLRMANQAGWFITNQWEAEAIWNGGASPKDTEVRFLSGIPPDNAEGSLAARSHFGHGILTWTVPYLFRTPPGYNLYVRGPSNWCKDGVCPLDGIVETDWAVATFTMNWKITRPGLPIRFDSGEPISMVFPVRRHDLENMEPEVRDISDDAETAEGYQEWRSSRLFFGEMLRSSSRPFWQEHYFIGTTPTCKAFDGHQVHLRLKPFRLARRRSSVRVSDDNR